jgi:hypothetical protein
VFNKQIDSGGIDHKINSIEHLVPSYDGSLLAPGRGSVGAVKLSGHFYVGEQRTPNRNKKTLTAVVDMLTEPVDGLAKAYPTMTIMTR